MPFICYYQGEDVAPARERGLKCKSFKITPPLEGRSREGAWIEIDLITKMPFSCFVAPARERGLK